MITPEQISIAIHSPLPHVQKNWPGVLGSLHTMHLDSRQGVIMTLATISVEAREFEPINEYGNDAYFYKMYEGREDLGNVRPGDGIRFHGRGFVQTTGRANYKALTPILGIDLEVHPDTLLESGPAAIALAYYFEHHGCVDWAHKAMTATQPRCNFCNYEGLLLIGHDYKGKPSYRRPKLAEPTCSACAWKTARRTVNGGLHGYPEFIRSVNNLLPLVA